MVRCRILRSEAPLGMHYNPAGLLVPNADERHLSRIVAIAGPGGGNVTVTGVTEPRATIGQTVTIQGTGFVVGQDVAIDGQAVSSPTFDSSTQITATVPAGVMRDVAVDVSVAGVSLADAFLVEPKYGADEPQPPATEILIENYTPGDLAAGTGYLSENFNRYTDAVADMSLMLLGNSHYGTNGNRKTAISETDGKSLITGRSGTGLAARTQYTAAQQVYKWQTPTENGAFGSYAGALVVQFWVRFPDASGFYDGQGGKFMELWYWQHRGRVQMGLRPSAWNWNNGWCPHDESAAGQEFVSSTTPLPSSLNDGFWHRVTLFYLCNSVNAVGWQGGTTWTSISSRDGRVASWIDGTKSTDAASGTALDFIGGEDFAVDEFHPMRLQYPDTCNGLTAAFNTDYDDIKIWVVL